jgi:hypothetical protein
MSTVQAQDVLDRAVCLLGLVGGQLERPARRGCVEFAWGVNCLFETGVAILALNDLILYTSFVPE